MNTIAQTSNTSQKGQTATHGVSTQAACIHNLRCSVVQDTIIVGPAESSAFWGVNSLSVLCQAQRASTPAAETDNSTALRRSQTLQCGSTSLTAVAGCMCEDTRAFKPTQVVAISDGPCIYAARQQCCKQVATASTFKPVKQCFVCNSKETSSQ
jgi:hypothetical protein